MTQATRAGLSAVVAVFLIAAVPGPIYSLTPRSTGETIVPGNSVGNLLIGESFQKVMAQISTFWGARQAVFGDTKEVILVYGESGLAFVTTTPMNPTISRIIVTNPALLMVRTGIHVGNRDHDILRVYGPGMIMNCTVYGGGLSGYQIRSYQELGVSFVIDAQGYIVSITIHQLNDGALARGIGIAGSGRSWSELLVVQP